MTITLNYYIIVNEKSLINYCGKITRIRKNYEIKITIKKSSKKYFT